MKTEEKRSDQIHVKQHVDEATIRKHLKNFIGKDGIDNPSVALGTSHYNPTKTQAPTNLK